MTIKNLNPAIAVKTGLSKIDALDLSEIRLKLTMSPECGGYGWPDAETDEAIGGYRQFLKSVLAHRNKPESEPGRADEASLHCLAPDAVVDIVWHTHILFTRKYHNDCKEIFGEYLHHLPDTTGAEQED